MMKEVYTVTPKCIDGRGEHGCAEVLAQRMAKYMVKSACDGEGKAKFIISIRSVPET